MSTRYVKEQRGEIT